MTAENSSENENNIPQKMNVVRKINMKSGWGEVHSLRVETSHALQSLFFYIWGRRNGNSYIQKRGGIDHASYSEP